MDTSVTVTESRPGQSTSQGVSPWLRLWQRLALGIVLLISIFMNFYQLGQSGFGNLYYASGVRSMVDSFHNFFFVSYDPGGFITIDKPPLGFWLQAISVEIFGFTPFSIFLPQALAGVLSVILLYTLVQRHFGVTAGLLAALALAITPISVVTNRNNTIDSTLALMMLLGAWAVIRAVETGKWRWLLLCAAFVGTGFNIKMLGFVPCCTDTVYVYRNHKPKLRPAKHFTAGAGAMTFYQEDPTCEYTRWMLVKAGFVTGVAFLIVTVSLAAAILGNGLMLAVIGSSIGCALFAFSIVSIVKARDVRGMLFPVLDILHIGLWIIGAAYVACIAWGKEATDTSLANALVAWR